MPMRNDPRAPQRIDPRMPQRLDQRSPPGAGSLYNAPYAQRSYPTNASPMNVDNYRSMSTATLPRPPYQPPGSNYQTSSAYALRQQPYMSNPPTHTAHGRVVPDRSLDERTMSMSSYGRDNDQFTNGRGSVNRNYSADSDSHIDQRSPESMRQMSATETARGRIPSQGSIQSRTMSMASTMTSNMTSPALGYDDSLSPQPSLAGQVSVRSEGSRMSQMTGSTLVATKRQSRVYGALLSQVADAFRSVNVGEKEKDGLVYKSVFTGYDAVEQIRSIIRTSDRNLALLLGRSLDAQKYFHEVSYAHRLRDSPNELYQFREAVMEEANDVNGVFTLLTECYSPTCTRDHLCYSIACPRRLEQQSRLNLRLQPGLKRENSQSSLHDENTDEQKLWSKTVSPEVLKSVDKTEQQRQEIIAELMYTERDFVKDLEYLRDFWIKPLYHPELSPIPEHRRVKFVRTVFSNCQEVHAVNARLSSALTRRQQQPVVPRIGDIFLEYVTQFQPFIKYGANQLFGKLEFEKEKASNPAFAKFVDHTERLKESRKLELNGYLTKPTTRLARYPLLLKAINDKTADDNPDKREIPKVIDLVKAVLSEVNTESGKAENTQQLLQLNQSLKWGNIPHMDLKLTEDSRQMIFALRQLKKSATVDVADITAYLFDHAVLLVRTKTVNKREEQKVFRKPIPLELLVMPELEEMFAKPGTKRPSANALPGARTVSNSNAKDAGFPLTFRAFGKGGYEVTLYCAQPFFRDKWLKSVHAQQEKLRERSNMFVKTNINQRFFKGEVRVNCGVPIGKSNDTRTDCVTNFIDTGQRLAIGTNNGVYVVDRKPKDASHKPRRLFDIRFVTQIGLLASHGMLLVLADKVLWSFPLDDQVYEENIVVATKRGRKICHASYFNAGSCNAKDLVCCVKSSSLSSTIKVYEPMDSTIRGKKKSGLAKMLAGGQEILRPYKEFYIPMESNSIQFLRSKICVAGAKGFEIVSLETLETQSLLNDADTSLETFTRRGESTKPVFLQRMGGEFLLCYAEFAFFVSREGWRTRGNWQILWEGAPNAFATWGEQYILAFEPDFIEVRRTDTGGLVSVETAKNIRFLYFKEGGSDVSLFTDNALTDTDLSQILYVYEDENGEDVIASLDFWAVKQMGAEGKQAALPPPPASP